MRHVLRWASRLGPPAVVVVLGLSASDARAQATGPVPATRPPAATYYYYRPAVPAALPAMTRPAPSVTAPALAPVRRALPARGRTNNSHEYGPKHDYFYKS
jgi:hypothetical protein